VNSYPFLSPAQEGTPESPKPCLGPGGGGGQYLRGERFLVLRYAISADAAVTHYDVVLDAVGGISSAPILTAISAVAPLGQVVALGVYRPDLAAVIPVRTLLEKESTLRRSKAYRLSAERDDFATALGQLTDCRDAYSPIITSTPSWPPDDP
jgi:threonine dehydrogenase-like Zn-dependent dehydrogenase